MDSDQKKKSHLSVQFSLLLKWEENVAMRKLVFYSNNGSLKIKTPSV